MGIRVNRTRSLHREIALILLGVLIVYAVTEYAVDQLSILPSYEALERDEARKDVNRCVKAIRREIHHLDLFVSDWAGWDDTYEFVWKPNDEYLESNMAQATFMENGINAIALFDPEGFLIWGKAIDLETNGEVPLGDFIATPLAERYRMVEAGSSAGRAGFMLTARGPMLVSFRSILTSEDGGPSRGTLVMGRLLTEDAQAELTEQTEVAFTITPVQDLAEGELRVLTRIKQADGLLVEAVSDSQLHVSAEMADIDGNPGLVIRAEIPRSITQRGVNTLRAALLSTVGGGLVLVLLLMVLLRRTVITPLTDLTDQVVAINRTGDLSPRVGMDRSDEIGTLGREFDGMLDRLESDLLERQRMEDALRESEERYRSFVTDFQGIAFRLGPDGKPVFFHGAVEGITGYSEQEFVSGTPEWLDVVHGEDAGQVKEAIEKALHSPGFAEQREYRIVCRDGTTRWVHAAAKCTCDASGAPAFAEGAIYDITELKEMQERVARAEHLASIGEMGASIAHEIRNPLAGISGAVQVLAQSVGEEDERKPVFREVIEQVARVDGTVRSLLAFAKPWAPEKQPTLVRAVLESAVKEAEKHPSFERVEFAVGADPHLEANLDAGLLQQVLRNVLHNAAEAMPEGGRIRLGADTSAAVLRITVSDSGAGMPPEIEDKVFQPFFTTRTHGIGLGLAVCRQIMEAHGGTVSLSSVPGQGTVVLIEIPVGAWTWRNAYSSSTTST